MSDINVGIIGAGGIAALSHLPELQHVDGMRVVSVAGRTESRLKTLCERFGIPRYVTDWEELLSDDVVNAVIVGLPHPLHAAAGMKVLEAGKHLFMQKPLCATMAEADALVTAAEARPELAVYCRPSFGSEVVRMREMVQAGDIGTVSGAAARHSHGGPEVYYAEVADAFGEEHRSDDLWFFDAGKASVGALFDMGVYAVSQLVAVLGTAVSVTARLSTVAKPTTLDDTATLIIEFENGALGTAETSWCDPARTSCTRVHGTTGKLWWPGTEGHPLDLYRPSSAVRENAPPTLEHPSVPEGVNQHEEWLSCIRNRTQPSLSNIWSARHVTEILLAALESSRTGARVALRSTPERQL